MLPTIRICTQMYARAHNLRHVKNAPSANELAHANAHEQARAHVHELGAEARSHDANRLTRDAVDLIKRGRTASYSTASCQCPCTFA